MPTIDTINTKLKIDVYNGDHRPPHIHAIYNEFEVLIEIQNGSIYAGSLPSRQLRLVYKWLEGNRVWALSVFYELNPLLK
ncbi:MAG: DUF4160 domain-containing protein [Bacteroidetes bacterium]|nr:DUF4160 domain-containing protein [Bacteroidota bacterium]